MARIQATLDAKEFISAYRVGPTDFTRRRTLTFANLVTNLVCGMTRSLQGEFDDFFSRLANQAHLVRAVSKSAFSQARRKFLPSAFRALNDLLLNHWELHVVVPRCHGFRLLGGDATTLHLPCLPEVIDEFSVQGDRWGGQTPMAQVLRGRLCAGCGRLMRWEWWAPPIGNLRRYPYSCERKFFSQYRPLGLNRPAARRQPAAASRPSPMSCLHDSIRQSTTIFS